MLISSAAQKSDRRLPSFPPALSPRFQRLLSCYNQLRCSVCPALLQDFSSGTFFNRVIDDGKASDNTRHLSHHPKTGEPYLLPPLDIRRVLLVSIRALSPRAAAHLDFAW